MLVVGGLVFGVAVLVAPSAPALAIDRVGAADELLALTNVSRTSNGLPSLARDPRLSSVATSRSEDMIGRDYFSHSIPPDGRTVIDVLESLGVRGVAAENIEHTHAVDFTTVQFANADFMNSPSHRSAVLGPRWTRAGAGVAEGGGRKMYTVVFLQPPAVAAEAPPPTARPAPVVPTGGARRADSPVAPVGLVDGLINRLLRLALNL